MCPFALPATFCVIENCYRGGFTQLLVKQFQNLQSFLLAHAFQLSDSSCCFPLGALGMTCLLRHPRGAVAPLRLVPCVGRGSATGSPRRCPGLGQGWAAAGCSGHGQRLFAGTARPRAARSSPVPSPDTGTISAGSCTSAPQLSLQS